MEIQKENGVDLTGVEQHGFKNSKSTASAGLIIQSILSRALDSGNFALMASIDVYVCDMRINNKNPMN